MNKYLATAISGCILFWIVLLAAIVIAKKIGQKMEAEMIKEV